MLNEPYPQQQAAIVRGDGADDKALGLVPKAPRIYFVRHGRSVHNESAEDRPLIWDAPLHDKGIRQAELLQETFRGLPLEAVVASPLTRALQTALIALGAVDGTGAGVDNGADDGSGADEGAEKVGHDLKRRKFEQRCPVLAWPDMTEQLHESDDLGSPVPELRLRFPSVDFSRLPQDGSTWWWRDPALPATGGALGAREVWEQFGRGGPLSTKQLRYDEPEDSFRLRITKLLQDLDATVCSHCHVAVFAHCWVLDEIWRQRFGRGRRFANAELAVVEVRQHGAWHWLRDGEDSDSSDSSSS